MNVCIDLLRQSQSHKSCFTSIVKKADSHQFSEANRIPQVLFYNQASFLVAAELELTIAPDIGGTLLPVGAHVGRRVLPAPELKLQAADIIREGILPPVELLGAATARLLAGIS